MIDLLTTQISFLIFEAIFCLLSALVYSVSHDPLRIRKASVLSLNISCGIMLICEYLFYVYKGSTAPFDVTIMKIVNAAVYYIIVLLMLFYTMLVAVRLFGRFNLKPDMPCRKRFIAVCVIVVAGLILVTVSQFTGIYYFFDSNNLYQRGPLFWLAALIPTSGAFLIASVILEFRKKIHLSELLVLISYMVLPLVGEVVQFLFYGNSLMNICIGLSVLLMFFENMIHKEKEIVKVSKTEIRTGLANEYGYIEWLNEMRRNPEIKNYAAVFFDLRKFSDINRRYGIANGNRILSAFANILLEKIEKDEILGRQFSNQFVAIVKKQNLDDLLKLLSGVDVSFMNIDTRQEDQVHLAAHIGVYMIDRTDLDGESILVFAGQALSSAKSKESDDVVWLTQDLIDALSERKKLESDIKQALESGEFQPYYQPKVNIKTGKICGAEALSRWIHNGNIISPAKFIPIMEANDTICLLDFSILQSVCNDIAGWLKAGVEVPTVSVNFSRRNLISPDLASRIDSIVESAGIPKKLIEIEVTESSSELPVGVLKNCVESIQKLGYQVSIDDFGCASASLSLLREIAFNTIKIDKGFVDHLNTKDISILTHIIRLASEIDMRIVAEGVEKKEQIETLDRLGVEVIQGYFFDKPLPKEEITRRLQSPYYDL